MHDSDPSPTVSFEALTDSAVTALEARRVGGLDEAPRLRGAVELALAPVLQSAPDAVAAMSRKGRYLVEFSPGGLEGLKSGAIKFMERRDGRLQPTLMAQGRISENATMAGRAAQRVGNVAALANLAVLIVVQGQLVSMERALQRIEEKVDAVRKQLDDQKVAAVRGRLRSLRTLREDMATEEWTADDTVRWRVALDQADTEFHQIEAYARLQCEEYARKISAANLNAAWFGPSGQALAQALHDHVDRFRHHQELLFLCLVGRTVVAHLGRRAGSGRLADDLEQDLTRARAEVEAHERLIKDRALDFTTKLRFAKFEIGIRRALILDAESYRGQADTRVKAIREQVAMLSSVGPSRVSALIEVGDDGKVERVDLLA